MSSKGLSLILLFLALGALAQANQNPPNLQQLRRFARHMFPARVPQVDVPVQVDNSTGLTSSGKCHFGSIPAKSDKGDCYQLKCLTITDCTFTFGSNSTCNLSTSTCECDSSHSLDSLTQSCSLPKIPTLSCLFPNDCSTMYNSICTNGQCRCKKDYRPTANGQCEAMICSIDDQCRELGVNSICRGYFCACADNYQLDLSTRKCVPLPVTPAGKSCTENSKCADNSKCKWNEDADDDQCMCNLGYKALGGRCSKMYCGDDQQCRNTFGDNTRCRGWSCECDSNSVLDLNTQKCVSNKKQINGYCTFADSECGLNAKCIDNQCRCKLGFDTKDNTNCDQTTCSSKYDCTSKNDHTICNFGQCKCDYSAGYSLDIANQKCKGNSKKLGDFCTNDMQCGSYANCVFNSCQCQANYSRKKTNEMDCKLSSCSWTSECQIQDSNSVCEFGFCSCATGYSIDYTTQKCTNWADDYSGAMSTGLAAVGMVSLVSIIMAVIVMIIRARQSGRLLATTSGGSSASSAKTATAVVNAKITIPQKS